ncbi:MAG: twin-arginine translocase subunit TatC [Bacteroidetes bacterium]|nr:twin-arginine translocase subunit TatC [Bacteroidota bacterium]
MAEETSNKKKDSRGNDEAQMSFWEHLEELRWLLIRSAIVMILMGIVAFLARRIIFDHIILAPNSPGFITNRVFCYLGRMWHLDSLCYQVVQLKIINYNMAGQFMTHINVSAISGLILAMPYFIREIWRFLKPALKENEKKYSYIAMFISFFLFMTGICFGYFIIVPLTLYFFGNYYVSEMVQNSIALSSYINTVVYTTIAVGLLFLLPVFVLLLVKLGVMSSAFLKRTRKVSIVIILILAAIIGPPDVPTQIILSVPLYALFELSVWVAGKIEKKKEPAG